MLGGGVFNLPQNMAAGAGLGAVILAWMITFAGVYALANTFRLLARCRPDLSAGIYAYARAGFGPCAGFEMAWGYWLSAAFGNVAFAVLIHQTLGYLFPAVKESALRALISGTLLIWIMHSIVLSGVKKALVLNLLSGLLSLVMMFAILVVMARAVNAERLVADLWGTRAQLGSVLAQIKSTMLVTLWVFTGIEGAVVLSGRAARPAQIGAATLMGLAVCTLLYVLMSVLPFGLMPQPELAKLAAPSAASVLQKLLGGWGQTLVVAALLLTLLNSWLAWTVLAAELPFEAAQGGLFPRFLARRNRFGAPARALWISSLLMQMILFVAVFAEDIWRWLISMTSVMILPPYLASAAFLWRSAAARQPAPDSGVSRRAARISSGLSMAYSVWLLYAAGPKFVLISALLFAFGLPIYYYARRERMRGTSAL